MFGRKKGNNKMYNFIVLHKLDGKVISRWDFGEELDRAIDFIHDVMEDAYQTGYHHYTVVDEFTSKTYYNQRFALDNAE
jgi:hypothetical protein